MKRFSFLLFVGILAAMDSFAGEEGVVSKTEKGISKGAEAAGKGIEKGVDYTAKGVQKGVDATGRGLKKANEWIEEKVLKSSGKTTEKPVEKP
jgi:hypothetical protein